MQQQTSEKANATSSTQDRLNETHNNASNLAENIPLDSGLVIRRRDDKWFTTLGDTTVTKPTTTKEEQIEQLETDQYSIMIKIAIHVYKSMRDQDHYNANKDRMTQAGL